MPADDEEAENGMLGITMIGVSEGFDPVEKLGLTTAKAHRGS